MLKAARASLFHSVRDTLILKTDKARLASTTRMRWWKEGSFGSVSHGPAMKSQVWGVARFGGPLALAFLSWASMSLAGETGSESELIRRVKHVERRVNVLDYGAFADGKSHQLKTLFKSQQEIDKKYGKGKYTLEDEADFVAINAALAKAKREANEHLPEGDYGLWILYLPTGIYKVNRTLDLSNCWGLNIRGAGREATRISFQSSSPLFYCEAGASIVFRGFTVESTIAAKSTAFHFHNTIGGDGPNYPAFKFMFDNLVISNFYSAVLTTGNTMTSELVFRSCRFLNCLTGLHLKNVQSMNHNFFGCDFEASQGDDHYAPFKASDVAYIRVEAGGFVNVYGGSVLLHGTTLLLNPLPSGINHINGIYNFHGVAWEQWSAGKPLLFYKKGEQPMNAKINIEGCRAHQYSAARKAGALLGSVDNGMNVTIRNSNFTFGIIELKINATTRYQWGSLTLDNSKYVELIENRTATVKQQTNINHHVRSINSILSPRDHTVFDGKPKFDQMDFDILPFAASMISTKSKRIYYSEPDGTLEGSNGLIYMQLPKHGTLVSIGVVKSSNEEASYSISDKSGKIVFGKIRTDAKEKKGFIKDIEMLNDGVNWDGTIRIKLSGERKNSAGRIFCEYY